MRRVILSGTSYAGKSTLLDALAKEGYITVPEAETEIRQGLREKLGEDATRKWIRENYFKFKNLVGLRAAEIESSIDAGPDETWISDRSAVCYIGYCHMRGVEVP